MHFWASLSLNPNSQNWTAARKNGQKVSLQRCPLLTHYFEYPTLKQALSKILNKPRHIQLVYLRSRFVARSFGEILRDILRDNPLANLTRVIEHFALYEVSPYTIHCKICMTNPTSTWHMTKKLSSTRTPTFSVHSNVVLQDPAHVFYVLLLQHQGCIWRGKNHPSKQKKTEEKRFSFQAQ